MSASLLIALASAVASVLSALAALISTNQTRRAIKNENEKMFKGNTFSSFMKPGMEFAIFLRRLQIQKMLSEVLRPSQLVVGFVQI